MPDAEPYFEYNNHVDFLNQFFPGDPEKTLGGKNTYFPNFGDSESWVSSSFSKVSQTPYKIEEVDIPHLYDQEDSILIETNVVGFSDDPWNIPDHLFTIKINNTTYLDSSFFEGYTNKVYQFMVPVEEVSAEDQLLLKYDPLLHTFNTNTLAIAYIKAKYKRTFDADGQAQFTFNLSNDENKYVEISNFQSGNEVWLFDLKNRLRIKAHTEDGLVKIYIPQVSNPEDRTFVLVNLDDNTVVHQVNNLESKNFVNYFSSENEGNYIILTHPNLMQPDENGINQIERYAAYRRSEAGGAYEVSIVDINELYDQFAWGIQKHPLSIRNFINFALDRWKTKPELLNLIGKSISYNKTRFSSVEFGNCLVPTFGHSPSDYYLTIRDAFECHPQIGVGRIPALYPFEVRNYLDKVEEYEANLPCILEERKWKKEAIHIAGGFDFQEGHEFAGMLKGYGKTYEAPKMGEMWFIPM